MGWMKSSFIIIIIETRVVHRAETTRDHHHHRDSRVTRAMVKARDDGGRDD